jgi:nitrate reductase alpha subunit
LAGDARSTLWALPVHLKDYDLDSVCEMTSCPKPLVERLIEDIATMKPVSIHQGEGINHWFHATEMNRAAHLPLMLTGNFGRPGAGCYTWAGNYKAALFQGSPWTGPGFKGWVAEDPFELSLDPSTPGRQVHAHAYTKDEEPAYWNHGDGLDRRHAARGRSSRATHMPTPTKALIFNNVNLINNAKWAYEMIKNVNPNVEMIVSIDIQMTASIEYADLALPANSWLEFQDLEVTASCSNPFLQVWKGGIDPVFDSETTSDPRGNREALGR